MGAQRGARASRRLGKKRRIGRRVERAESLRGGL